jgi:hypothetical protein
MLSSSHRPICSSFSVLPGFLYALTVKILFPFKVVMKDLIGVPLWMKNSYVRETTVPELMPYRSEEETLPLPLPR